MTRRVSRSPQLRFGLRALLLCTFILAVVFAWFASQLAEGRRHQRIAAELRAAGCDVQFSHREWVPMANPPTSAIVGGGTPIEERSTLPVFMERFGIATGVRRIENITIRSRSELVTAFKLVKEIGQVDSISFYETGISQSQLSEMFANVHVKKMYASGERLPRTSMQWLNHDGLTWLCLNRTQLSNPAVNDLPDTLEYLDATRTRINDDGLSSFVRLKNLKTLNLSRTPTSENAISALRQKMPWCEVKWEALRQP